VIARPNTTLTPTLVLSAYTQGFFPMANKHGEIGFYAYEPRGIIPLDERFTVRKSLRQILKEKNYEIRFDTAPLEVLRACSRTEENVPTAERWLSEELIEI
jgi:leucyl/phenylalanyl-tRNA--protein transferase